MSIKVNLKKTIDNSYEIIIGNNILSKIVVDLKKINFANRYIIITDSNVKKLYGHKLLELFKNHKLKVDLISFQAGEKSKNSEVKKKIENQMLKLGCGRDTCIVSFGGGVVGDLSGYIASTFNRGIAFVQIPTTILACADSSVGGKTGINNEFGKNLIGSFYQPKKVYIDTLFWKTLNKKEIRNGLAETVKHALIYDKMFFSFLEKKYNDVLKTDIAQHITNKNCLIKSKIVEKDEKENNLRQILNYGHTVGHALEKLSNFKISHGQGVSVGMCVAGKISSILGCLSEKELQKQNDLLKKIGLSTKIPRNIKIADIIKTIKLDKKNKKGKIRFVVLEKIGKTKKHKKEYSFEIDDKILRKVLVEIY